MRSDSRRVSVFTGGASKAQVKISARVGLLMPFQALILLGLSPLCGLQVNGGRGWQWGADPIANVFKRAPVWIGDVSYCQYVRRRSADQLTVSSTERLHL